VQCPSPQTKSKPLATVEADEFVENKKLPHQKRLRQLESVAESVLQLSDFGQMPHLRIRELHRTGVYAGIRVSTTR
jgi:hypothetical protein